jgi:hypothetical protein
MASPHLHHIGEALPIPPAVDEFPAIGGTAEACQGFPFERAGKIPAFDKVISRLASR